jgi:hypothetical protein
MCRYVVTHAQILSGRAALEQDDQNVCTYVVFGMHFEFSYNVCSMPLTSVSLVLLKQCILACAL